MMIILYKLLPFTININLRKLSINLVDVYNILHNIMKKKLF